MHPLPSHRTRLAPPSQHRSWGPFSFAGRHWTGICRVASRRFASISPWWIVGLSLAGLAILIVVGAGSVAVLASDPQRRLATQSYTNLDPMAYRLAYPAMAALLVQGHTVPGLHANFVPQGIDYLRDDTQRAVISGYFCERFERAPLRQGLISLCGQKQSALYLIDLEDGRALRVALLEERNGEPMRRHAGGIAVLFDRLWLPDTFEVLRFDLAELVDGWSKSITMAPENTQRIGVDSSGDFITANGDMLWIGNFQRASRGAPLPDHYRSLASGTSGLTTGYRIDPDTLRPMNTQRYTVHFGRRAYEVYRPDAGLHHRNEVQGLSFVDERHVVLSSSWGDAPSALSFHRLPDKPSDAPRVALPDGSTIPIWSVFPATREMLINAPPGSEGIAFDGHLLLTVFEGGALPYRERWQTIEDRMILFQPPGAIRSGPPIKSPVTTD